jgi:hypothetical protein
MAARILKITPAGSINVDRSRLLTRLSSAQVERFFVLEARSTEDGT